MKFPTNTDRIFVIYHFLRKKIGPAKKRRRRRRMNNCVELFCTGGPVLFQVPCTILPIPAECEFVLLFKTHNTHTSKTVAYRNSNHFSCTFLHKIHSSCPGARQ